MSAYTVVARSKNNGSCRSHLEMAKAYFPKGSMPCYSLHTGLEAATILSLRGQCVYHKATGSLRVWKLLPASFNNRPPYGSQPLNASDLLVD